MRAEGAGPKPKGKGPAKANGPCGCTDKFSDTLLVGNLLLPEEENVQVGDVRLQQEPGLVVWPGQQNHRVIPWPHHGPYFPQSFLTPDDNLGHPLEKLDEHVLESLLPAIEPPEPEPDYYWVHPDQNANEGYRVRIVIPSWLSSTVQPVDEVGHRAGEIHKVPTHWILMH